MVTLYAYHDNIIGWVDICTSAFGAFRGRPRRRPAQLLQSASSEGFKTGGDGSLAEGSGVLMRWFFLWVLALPS
jgi:hypothetical protein